MLLKIHQLCLSRNQFLSHGNTTALLDTSAHRQTLATAFAQDLFKDRTIHVCFSLILQINLQKCGVFLYRNLLLAWVCVTFNDLSK